MEELIFSVETHSSKELRHFKFLCVSFVAQLLGSNTFIHKVGEKKLEGWEESGAVSKHLLRFQVSEEPDDSGDDGGDDGGASLQQLQQR